MRPLVLVLKKQSELVPLNSVNSNKSCQIYLYNISWCFKCVIQIMFFIVIAIPKGMSGRENSNLFIVPAVSQFKN